MKNKNDVINLPNILSISRVVASPVVFFLLAYGRHYLFLILGIGLFFFIEFTDILDGWIARRRKEVTEVGKIIDPMADKIVTFSYFFAILIYGFYPFWMLYLIFFRELAITLLRMVYSKKVKTLPALFSGKLKHNVQAAGAFIIAIVMLLKIPSMGKWIFYTMLVITIITLLSGIEYLIYILRSHDE